MADATVPPPPLGVLWKRQDDLELPETATWEKVGLKALNPSRVLTYHCFHDPDETSPDVLHLCTLHDEIDSAVLAAYGRLDLRRTRDFILDYDDEKSEEDDSVRARKRTKPWRHRCPDDIRDEVLARLLSLNRERATDTQTSPSVLRESR